jgi:hypothetical protein
MAGQRPTWRVGVALVHGYSKPLKLLLISKMAVLADLLRCLDSCSIHAPTPDYTDFFDFSRVLCPAQKGRARQSGFHGTG